MKIDTMEDGLAYVESLLPNIDGLFMMTGGRSAGRADIEVEGSDRRMRVEVGAPYNGYCGIRAAQRVEQVVITARDCERSDRGGHWNNKTRTFPKRKDGTFNGAGIIKALRELAEEMRTATLRRAEREAQQSAANGKQAEVRGLLRGRGLDGLVASNSCAIAVLGMEVTAGVTVHPGGLVELNFVRMDHLQAAEVLRRLGAIK